MKTSHSGFISPLLLALIALLILGGGAYVYMQNRQVNQPVTATSAATIDPLGRTIFRNEKYGFEFEYSNKLEPIIYDTANGIGMVSGKTNPCLLNGEFYDKLEMAANKNTDNGYPSHLSLCVMDDQMLFGKSNPDMTLASYAKTRFDLSYAPSLPSQLREVTLNNGIKAVELYIPDYFKAIYIRLKSGKVLEVADPYENLVIVRNTIVVF